MIRPESVITALIGAAPGFVERDPLMIVRLLQEPAGRPIRAGGRP
jgi:hypothetical protein